MANLVCPYPPKKTIISGGTVFAVFDLGQIAYQGPVMRTAFLVLKELVLIQNKSHDN